MVSDKEEMVLANNTPARSPTTNPFLHPSLKPRRSFSITPKTNAKQSSQFRKIPFTELCSLPFKSVFLYDWWLHRVDPKGLLAVGGFVCRGNLGNLGVRTFHSVAIVKRHDASTLETADGIIVTINGLINKSRTCSNGLPSEVCNHFFLGFPHYWEEFADENFPTRFSSMSSSSCSSTFLPSSWDEIPVTRMNEFFMSPRSDAENCCLAQKLFDDVIEKCGYNCVQDESAHKRKKNGGQSKMDTKVFTPSSIVTRSMSRVKNPVMEQEESLSSKPSDGGEKTSKGREKQSKGVGSESGSKKCRETTFAQEDKQVMGNPYKSTLRRSSRNMNKKKETH